MIRFSPFVTSGEVLVKVRYCSLLVGVMAIAAVLATGCTDVTENFPEGGCVKDALRCNNNNVERCSEDQTAFVLYKTCAPDSPCTGDPPDCEGVGGGGTTCETANDCTLDVGACRQVACVDSLCVVEIIEENGECTDFDQCTENDACDANGFCRGTAIVCDDGEPCTADACDPETGCTNEPSSGAQCDDGEPCTKDDTCTEGACAGTAANCDDGNACTDDSCDIATGECVYVIKAGDCDDDDPCTANDKCSAGVCAGTPSCPCKIDIEGDCDKYNTGDPCKGSYYCNPDEPDEPANTDGQCVLDPTTAVQCDQSGLGGCEVNQCFNKDGVADCQVVTKDDGEPCDDGSECTLGDTCVAGSCVGELDVKIQGCGFFRLRWHTLTGDSWLWELTEYRLVGTTNYPQIYGTAENGQYRVRAIGPGL